jgi:hypothetical protein
MLSANKKVNDSASGQDKATKKSEAQAQVIPANPLWSRLLAVDNTTSVLQRKCEACKEEEQVQTKLRVGTANDQYEQEADAVADKVMRMPEVFSHKAAIVENYPSVTSHDQSSMHNSAQRKCMLQREPIKSSEVSTDVSAKLQTTLNSPGIGRPLPPLVRARVEPVLNADLSHVKVHTDNTANIAAQNLNARAFTHKNHVFIRSSESEFDTALMSHEATHVIQQTGHIHLQPDQQSNHKKLPNHDQADVSTGESATDIQKDPQDFSSESYDEFGERIRALAIVRLSRNIEVLNEWIQYVSNMEGFQMQAQLMTSLVTDYALNAQQTVGGRARFESFAGTDNAAERAMHGSALASDASYKEGANNFMVFLGSKTRGYMTTPSVTERMQVLVGDRGETSLAESRYVAADPKYRLYVGAVKRYESGESGGCQTCHDINFAWQRTADIYSDPLPSGPVFPDFPDLIEQTSSSSSDVKSGPVGANKALFSSSEQRALQMFINNMALSETNQKPEIVEQPNKFLPSTPLPKSIDLPVPRSKLCGSLPKAQESDEQANFDPHSWGPNANVVADIISRINAVLVPLGPRGYRVIHRRSFDRLWAAKPGELELIQSEIIANISERQNQYRQLQNLIRIGFLPFTELCPIVDELLPTTNVYNQIQVRQAIAEQRAIEFLTSALDLILLAFAIIFPPSIMATLPLRVGLGLTKLAIGPTQVRRGKAVNLGAHSGVFSPNQEARADVDISLGWANIISGGLDLISIGALRYLRRPPTNTGFENELIANGWRQEAGVLWTKSGETGTIWQSANTFNLVDEMGVTVGRVTEMSNGSQVLERLSIEGVAATGMTSHTAGSSSVAGVNKVTSLLPQPSNGAALSIMPPSPATSVSAPILPVPSQALEQTSASLSATQGPINYGLITQLPSNAPALGQAPAYSLPLGYEGRGGVMLMNRGLSPHDFANNGFRGSAIADDPTHMRLWLAAEQQLANSSQSNVYKRWVAAIDNGSVHTWSSEDLGKVYSAMWDKYKVMARDEGIDVATIHHWNYSKANYPYQVVDPRNLMPIYGRSQMSGGYHPAHQGGLHPLTSSGHPTNKPIAKVHELPLLNYDVPALNPNYPDMPMWWHPPMAEPEGVNRLPFGWDPLHPPQWNWPAEYQDLYPYLVNYSY